MPIICTRAAASTRFNGHLGAAQGQQHSYLRARLLQTFTTPGRYTWIVPEGVTSISVMAVGAGGKGGTIPLSSTIVGVNGGGGGGYAYMYNYPVTPGETYTVQVGCGGGTTERLGTPYWDTADDGIRSDRADYSTTKGSGGIASWFANAAVCRGGGGMNGNTSTAVGSITFTGNAYGGYYTLGPGISGGGMHGGMGGNVWTTTTGTIKIGGGGGAGSAVDENDSTGMGSFDGMSRGAGTSGGGGGGGAGFRNGSSASSGAVVRVQDFASWLTFQNNYAVWPSLQPASGAAAANTVALIFRTFTAATTGTYSLKATADNSADVYIDGVLITSVSENFNTVPTAVTFSLTAGTHMIKIRAYNSESVAGVAVAIYNPSNALIWDTYSTRNAYLSGYYGVTPGGQGGGIGLQGIIATSGGSGIVGTDARNGIDTSGTGQLLVGGTTYDGVSNVYARTSGFWSTWMNTYAVWPTLYNEVESYVIYREFTAPTTGTYNIRAAADNHANVFIDNTLVTSGDDNFNTTPSPVSVTLTAGLHVIRLNVKNDDNVCGVAVTITDSTDTTLLWDTLSTANTIPTGTYRITSGGGAGSGGYAGKGSLTGWLGTVTNSGNYGGGGGGGLTSANGFSGGGGQPGAHGAVRIMWEPGSSYPNTNTATYY